MSGGRERLARVTLDERSIRSRSPEVEHERAVAIYDLIEENSFTPKAGPGGPYHLMLGLEDNRLVLDIRTESGDAPVDRVQLPLSGFRRIIRDYFAICESYYEAIKRSSPRQIEAIDMGRRGLHNEGSELLKDRIAERVEVDFQTARRLFTLICVLHFRG